MDVTNEIDMNNSNAAFNATEYFSSLDESDILDSTADEQSHALNSSSSVNRFDRQELESLVLDHRFHTLIVIAEISPDFRWPWPSRLGQKNDSI